MFKWLVTQKNILGFPLSLNARVSSYLDLKFHNLSPFGGFLGVFMQTCMSCTDGGKETLQKNTLEWPVTLRNIWKKLYLVVVDSFLDRRKVIFKNAVFVLLKFRVTERDWNIPGGDA